MDVIESDVKVRLSQTASEESQHSLPALAYILSPFFFSVFIFYHPGMSCHFFWGGGGSPLFIALSHITNAWGDKVTYQWLSRHAHVFGGSRLYCTHV